MRLYEFEDPLRVKLVALASQLEADARDDNFETVVTTDDLIGYFRDNGLVLDKSDIYNMVKNPPLNNIIDNIKDDQVIFKGQHVDQEESPDEQEKIVKQMAHKALKK
jgi:hypothetical protein